MTPNTKRILAGILLTAAPALGVYKARQTAWGAFVATPAARQKGDAGAPVLMVEYSDFQCPMCMRIQPTLHTLLDTYVGKVRLAFKYYPLSRIHKHAMEAAHAAECAAEQNQFWPYQDKLFDTQPQWAILTDPTTAYLSIAKQVKLDLATFQACYADPAKEAMIKRDIAEGQSRQISATPTLFIDDERLVGESIQIDSARMIERALRRKK